MGKLVEKAVDQIISAQRAINPDGQCKLIPFSGDVRRGEPFDRKVSQKFPLLAYDPLQSRREAEPLGQGGDRLRR